MIGTVQQLAVTVLTPLHIGAGRGALHNEIDYVSAERIYVINQERMLAGLNDEQLRLAEAAAKLSRLLSPEEQRHYARYSLANPTGRGQVPQILSQTKDAFGHPYLPGSSLKGAIRTALAWAMLDAQDLPVDRRDLGSNPRFADDPLLGRLLGRDPYRDLLRALQVADSAPLKAEGALDLLKVTLYTLRGDRLAPKGEGWSFFVEAIQKGSELRLSVRLDDYLLGPQVSRMVELEHGRGWLERWLGHCRAFSASVITQEQSFYHHYRMDQLAAFYDDLATQAAGLDPGREALLQIAWGTGWQSKTVGTYLNDDELAMVRGQYRLGRSGVDEFPKTRRLVERGGGPSAPLGWVRLRLVDGDPQPQAAPPAPPKQTPRAAPSRPTATPPNAGAARPGTIADLIPGMVLEGTVKRIVPYGAFVDIGVGRDGLLHISQISEHRIERVEDALKAGQKVQVKVLSVDPAQGRVGLTMRGV